MRYRNLTVTAIGEFEAILRDSADYGAAAAENVLDRLLAIFDDVEQGRGLGHRRDDLGFAPHILFRNTRPLPFMVIYDQRTGIVLRVIHGRRLYAELVLDDFGLPMP